MTIDVKHIDRDKAVATWITDYLGLTSYKKIIEDVPKVDVSVDEDFQKLFNYYFQVRRNEKWRKEYYRIFETVKKKENPSFDEIFYALYEATGNVEASFASKMLASINPDKPIWDQYVIKNLGIKVPTDRIKHLHRIPEIYHQMEEWYEEYLETEDARTCIEHFDSLVPEYKWISDVKKIDNYLYTIR